MRILKFPLEPYGVTEVFTDGYPNFLSVGVDGKNQPCVWLEANPVNEGDTKTTVFEVVLTGQDVPEDTKRIVHEYVGTIFLKTADATLPIYVMHVYQWYPRLTSEQLRDMSRI